MSKIRPLLAAALLLIPSAAAAGASPARPAARPVPFALSDGLISHWKLDEPSAARSDSVGSNHLSDNNTVTQVAGKMGGAAEFAAANGEYLLKADNADLSIQPDTDFTFAGWFYLTSKSSYLGLFGKDDAAGVREYVLYYDQGLDRLVWMVFAPNDVADPIIASSFGSPTLNAWHFIVVWHDGADPAAVRGALVTLAPGVGLPPHAAPLAVLTALHDRLFGNERVSACTSTGG